MDVIVHSHHIPWWDIVVGNGVHVAIQLRPPDGPVPWVAGLVTAQHLVLAVLVQPVKELHQNAGPFQAGDHAHVLICDGGLQSMRVWAAALDRM